MKGESGECNVCHNQLPFCDCRKEGRQIPLGEVGCKICAKSISRIFVDHLEEHMDEVKS